MHIVIHDVISSPKRGSIDFPKEPLFKQQTFGDQNERPGPQIEMSKYEPSNWGTIWLFNSSPWKDPPCYQVRETIYFYGPA